MTTEAIERARGCIVGAAVGDALGMPVEFALSPLAKPVRDMLPGRLPAGHFTDDTEQAIELGRALITGGRWQDRFADGLLAWYRAHPADVGMHTSQVLARMARAKKAQRLAAAEIVQRENPKSAGNGSLMRTHVIPVAFANDLDACLAAAEAQSAVTHAHELCVASCRALSAVIWGLLRGESPLPAVQNTIGLGSWPDEVRSVLDAALLDDWSLPLPSSGYVLNALRLALWGLLTTRSFEECALKVVNAGGDTDTNAAVAGAMAGACYGLERIPAGWREAVHGEWPVGSGNVWREAEFVELADALLRP